MSLLLFSSLLCLHHGSMFMDGCLQEAGCHKCSERLRMGMRSMARWSSPCTLSFSSTCLNSLAGRLVDGSAGLPLWISSKTACTPQDLLPQKARRLPLTLYLCHDLEKTVWLMFSCLESLSNLAFGTEFDFPALTNTSTDGSTPTMVFMSPLEMLFSLIPVAVIRHWPEEMWGRRVSLAAGNCLFLRKTKLGI